MSSLKNITIIVMVIVISMQFIRPHPNRQASSTVAVIMPEDIRNILSRSCFDCHSNNTRYPWYSSIQPVGWILARHIEKGKTDLNFDEFTGYSQRRKLSKLRSIITCVKEGLMPIPSYLLIHDEAALSPAEKLLVQEWAKRMTDSLAK